MMYVAGPSRGEGGPRLQVHNAVRLSPSSKEEKRSEWGGLGTVTPRAEATPASVQGGTGRHTDTRTRVPDRRALLGTPRAEGVPRGRVAPASAVWAHRPQRTPARASPHASVWACGPLCGAATRAAATVSGAGGLRGHRLWKGRQTFKPGSRGASPQGFGQGPPCIPGGAPVPPVGRVPPGQPRIRAALATCGWRAGFPPAPGRPLPVPAETSVCSQEQGPPHGCPAQEEPQSGAPRLPGCPPLPSF